MPATFKTPKTPKPGKRRKPCPVKPGDKVSCLSPVEAYYSNYSGNPESIFKPGMVGIVAAVNVASVRYDEHGDDTVAIVDFEGVEHGTPEHRTTSWRVALRYRNMTPVFVAGDYAVVNQKYSKWRGKTGLVEKVELFAEACELHGPIYHVHVKLYDVKHGDAVEVFKMSNLETTRAGR